MSYLGLRAGYSTVNSWHYQTRWVRNMRPGGTDIAGERKEGGREGKMERKRKRRGKDEKGRVG